MSFFTDKSKLNVKSSNLSTVAKFSSTLDDAYFLILANNSNKLELGCNNNAAVFGANSTSNFEAYIGLASDNVINKLAKFNNYDITFNRNLAVTGNVVPTSNITYDLGTPEYRWRDLYLSGNSIYVGQTILSSDPDTGSLFVKNSSNEIAPFVASKLKLLSSGATSNYSVIQSTDYGINLTFYDENDNEINHLDLGQGDTSMLPEGSNLYYTTARFDERLLTKTLDDINNGTSNRFIVNDVYSRDLHVSGTLYASNLSVYGDKTTLNTETYQTEQLQITSDTNGPVLTVTQLGTNDVLQVYSGSNIALLVNNSGFVGINNDDPMYNLDVMGTTNATFFRGDGSQLTNVNLSDRDTSLLTEGSNLYYTSERVGIIATSSNIDTSNLIENTSNELATRLTNTSNLISDRITDTSNLISNRLTDTSNLISDRLTDTSNLISDRLTDTSNVISDRLTNTSNVISERITNLTTSEIAEGSNLYWTVERFDERLLTKTLDHINNGTSNKYIINDVYDSDLNVTGTLTASNLIVHGTYTTLDTVTYQSKKMEIISDSESPALTVKQDGTSNIMEIYDDNNIVLSVINDGFVGINMLTPQNALDVNGTVNAISFIGDGLGLYNVNLSDRNTSMLTEGCNLYYTSERVGIISTSSNLETSNYILFSSNTISTTLTETSNQFSNDLLNTSNLISTRITNLSTNEIAEGLNLYYTEDRFDTRLDSKTADYVAEGTSNKYIVNNVYNNDLTIVGTLTASNLIVSGDITTLNTNTYQTERMEIISDVNGPALTITQKGTSDVMHIYDDELIALSVIKGGNVGVHTLTPEYTLDVSGTTRATFIIGDASGMSNVNLQDRDTNMLAEGSNLYYTSERVGAIADSSNMNTSNYIFDTSNLLISEITNTSNVLTDTINNVVNVEIDATLALLLTTSNLLINNIVDTSNILTYSINETIKTEINNTNSNLEYTSNVLTDSINLTSNQLTLIMQEAVSIQVQNSLENLTNSSNEIVNYITHTSNTLTDTINNVVSLQITETSNFIVDTSNILANSLDKYNTTISKRIDDLNTNNVVEGSNLYYTDARFDSMLLTKTLDNIKNGTSNKYIINDKYEGDLYVSGTLTASNLIINGNTTTLNTTTYQSKKLEIVSDAIGPALKVQQNGIFDIMQVYDDSNIVMSIVNGGKVGINTSSPSYTLDVVGTARATYLIGDGSGLTNVNLADRDTNMLIEGSNLYYTSDRVGVIATSCNLETSNYILNTSNTIAERLTLTSNILDAYIFATSNQLYANLIQSSHSITTNILDTSNTLINAIIENSNLSVITSNEIFVYLQETYITATSNFTVNSNLISSNIYETSNALINFVNFTYANITNTITDTSNVLIENILDSSNNTIVYTDSIFAILSNNLNITSNQLTSNIPIIYNQLDVNLNNVSNLISTQLNNNSNTISANILNNSNLFVNRILDTSNLISTRVTLTSNIISTRITDTSNQYATELTLTSNKFDMMFQSTSNDLYSYYNQTSNSLSTDVVYNSNSISDRITNLNLDMIAEGTSNTYIVNNIYDANLTITGTLTVNSLDVIDLGLLVLNDTGDYINTDMKTYVARITSNVLAAAPDIIQNSSMNFDLYDLNQSNYVATKQDKITGAASSIVDTNLLPNRVVVSNNYGKIAASSIYTSNLENILTLTAPVQLQIDNLNRASSNLAINILDQINFLNGSIGEGNGGIGNNISVTNVVSTCNLINIDPILYMKFENTNDSSKNASKNYAIPKVLPAYSGHTQNLLLWYPFNNTVNNYINNPDLNLYSMSGIDVFGTNVAGVNSLILDGKSLYEMGAFNNVKPTGVKLLDNNDSMTISFTMNTLSTTGRQYIFSFATSNLFTNDCVIESYMNTNTLNLAISRGSTTSVYTVPSTLTTNVDYNFTWKIMKNNESTSNCLSELNLNGANFSNISSLLYPLNCNYTYNMIGAQGGAFNTSYFNGYLSDFRVYNKALNDYEMDDNSLIKYPSYELHKNDLLLWYNFNGHLQNFDGDSKYALTMTTGITTYLLNTGLPSYSLSLTGSTYFTMNNLSMIDFNTVSDMYPTGITLSCSFIHMSVSGTRYLFSMTDSLNTTNPTRSIEVYLTNTQLNFRIRQNRTTSMQTITLNTNLVAKNKYTVSWVISKGTTDTNASWYIYLNGLNIYTSEFDRFYPTTAEYRYNYLASIYNTSYFQGIIDDWRVYKKALNSTEIMKINASFIAAKSFAANTNNLISWFNFDNDYTNAIIDNTIPLMYLNFKDKKMINYYDNDNYILYNNSSNMTPVYDSINNFTTINTAIANYSADNNTTLSTNVNRYVYYTDNVGIGNILGSINKKGFVLHFAFNTNVVTACPLYYSGNSTKIYIDISVYYGAIYIVVGDGIFKFDVYTGAVIDTNMWYVVDIVAKLTRGIMTFEVYINGVRQSLTGKYLNVIYGGASNVSLEYKGTNLQYRGENSGMYVGAYSPANIYTSNFNAADYTSGAILTTTYYSSNTAYYDYTGSNNSLKTPVGLINLLAASPDSSDNFNSYITQANNSKLYAYRTSTSITSNMLLDENLAIDETSHLSSNNIALNDVNSMLVEVIGNLYIDSRGFYHFALDLQNEIASELILYSTDSKVSIVVSSYYGGSLSSPSNSIANTNVLKYPIKLVQGYYKLYLKTLRTSLSSKTITAKYYKYPAYSGEYYSLTTSSFSVMNYSLLSNDTKTNMVNINPKLLVNFNAKIDKFSTTNPILTGNDIGMYALGFSQYNYMGIGYSNLYDGKVLMNTQFTGGYYYLPVSGIIQISAGNAHSLFLHNTGVVYGCGNNSYGGLGINSTTQSTTLKQVLGENGTGFITGITQISGGGYHSLFLQNTGIVYSCGINNNGQLGINSTTNQQVLKQVLGVNGTGFITGITQISTGNAHSLFLHNTGIVYSCGYNAEGQLGINSATNQTTLKQVLGENGTGFITGITQISAGLHSLFLHNTGIVYSCGYNGYGQLGINSTTQSTTLKQVLGENGTGFITGITQISGGIYHSIFLHNTGVVYSCGLNNFGQLGINSTTNSNVLKQVLGENGTGFITGITQISGGGYYSLFLHNTGIVYSCGYNNYGQLGINSTIQSTTLKQVLGENGTGFITGITQISVGFTHSLFLHNTSIVYSCGYNTSGQLGINSTTNQQTLQTISNYNTTLRDSYNSSNIIKVVPFSAGNSTSMANTEYSMILDNSGAVYFAGEGGVHSSNMSSDSIFNRINGLNNYKIVDIACGGSDTLATNNYSLFLTNTGNVLYTPSNGLIKNTTGGTLTDIVSIACRKNNTTAYYINSVGDVLQTTALVANSTFVSGINGVGTLKNIKQVDAGLSYTIFLSVSGEVYGLGDNTYGQLGTGNNTAAATVTYMKSLDGITNVNNIVKISCGNYYTMLLTKDTKVYACGYNVGGILGVGTTTDTNLLMEVVNLDGVGALTGIKDISCGVANITPLYAAVLLLGNNNVYINGGADGRLMILTAAESISDKVQSVHAAGSWLFLNTLKYDRRNLLNDTGYTTVIDEIASSNIYAIPDNSYTVNIQDFRMYTPEIMGDSNIIATELSKGLYKPPTVEYPNNILNSSNTTFDTSNFYSGYSSLSFNSSNNSFANLPPNLYDFSNDTTISMWVKGNNVPIKYPRVPLTESSNCVSSFSNMDAFKCFDNDSNNMLNIRSFTEIYGIGINTNGQLGDGTTAGRTIGYVPTIVPSTFTETFIQIEGTATTTGWYVHLLSDTGKAYSILQTGLTLINPTYFNNEKIKFIASGRSTYFITESGLLYGYGDNTYSQLGNGNTTTQNTPILISSSGWNGEKLVHVATGNQHTYITTSSGAIFTIGYNNKGQLGNGSTGNQATWTLYTTITNISRIYCCGDQTYITTNSGLLYSAGVRTAGAPPFLETSIPSNKKIIKVSFIPSQAAFALADDGTVYGYGTNSISMPNYTSAQTNFVEMISSLWTGFKIVDVVTGGDHTFYRLNNGQTYVVGNNNNGQLNISTSTSSSKTPILLNMGEAKVNLIYGGSMLIGYNILVMYPNKRYTEFHGNYGEYIKFDNLESSTVNFTRVSILTPTSTTTLTYPLSIKVYASNSESAMTESSVLWDMVGTYDNTLSFSASVQNVDIPSSRLQPLQYRYYAVLIHSRYNISVAEIAMYTNTSIESKKTLFDACIDEYNYVNISLQSSNIVASICNNNNISTTSVSHPDIYSTGVLYTLSYQYNSDPTNSTWRVYTNGSIVKTATPMYYPESGPYSTILLGKSVYGNSGLFNYFTGNLDDFRIYNRVLSDQEISQNYRGSVFNIEGYVADGEYINKFAMITSSDNYMVNKNFNDAYGLLRNIDANGFTMHFVFKTNDINNAPIYYIGGNKSSRISIKLLSGMLYILLGTELIVVSKQLITKGTWYIVDLVAIIVGGKITLQLYLNNVVSQIYLNNVLDVKHTVNYSNSLAPENVPNMGIYLGAYNNLAKSVKTVQNGAIFTNRYFSSNLITSNTTILPSIITRPAINSEDFSNMIADSETYSTYKLSSNVIVSDANYFFNYDGSNYLYDNFISYNSNSMSTSYILTEIDGNIKLSTGYYYFANDVQNSDITVEMYIGITDMRNVANHYGTDMITLDISLNKTSLYPIYITEGYYKFHSKTYSRENRKYLHHKYVKLDTYEGEYYTLLSTSFEYQQVSTMDVSLVNNMVSINNSVFINNIADKNILLKNEGSIESTVFKFGSSNYQTTDFLGTLGSNYTVQYTSNYNIDSVDYTSNYDVMLTSNYTGIAKQDTLTPQIIYNNNRVDALKGVVSIANGQSHTVVLEFDGTVFSIGHNLNGQLGLNSTVASAVFAPVRDVITSDLLVGVKGISCGAYWSHFIKKDGTAYGCGLNTNGQIGDNTTTQRTSIVAVRGVGGTGFMTNVKQIVGGFGTNNVSLFLQDNGTVFGCGQNTLGTLGDNSATQRNAPVQMIAVGNNISIFVSNVKQIAVNATTTVVLFNDGTVAACGGNAFGQVGDKTTTQRNMLVFVSGVDGVGNLSGISQISANGSSSHVLYLGNDGYVYGCGLNTSGQLGNNSSTNVSNPVRVLNVNNNGYLSGISQIANISTNSYFITLDSSILACGSGTTGQLGTSNIINSLTPKYVLKDTSNIINGASMFSTGGFDNINYISNNGVKQLVRDDRFYIENNQNDNLEVLVQDFRIYNSGSIITSNLIDLNVNDTYSLITAYSTYNEVTDGNRWMKSNDYYMYNNGVLNRSIYYNEGTVGIGTSAPTASLDIFTNDSTIYSIKTNNAIWAQTGVVSSSDRRIKKDICDIDDLSALNQILKIEPKTYNYIDKNRGTTKVFGFIAQQINEVIPEAVSIQTECIPNIYQTGSVQEGNIITLEIAMTDKMRVGDSIEVIIKNGARIRCDVMEIMTDKMFRINTEFEEETVFVYGVVVNDFHTIDKNYIYTLNVCATQDLHRQITSNQEKIEKQNEKVKSLMERFDSRMNSNVV